MLKKSLIINTDPGVDDVAAMTISLFAADLDVKMIVPTWGNVSLEYTLQNILDSENFLHTKVPAVKGTNQPLVCPATNAASAHGETGIVGFEFEKANNDLLISGLAATKMYETIKSSPEKVTFLGIGPLTDLALLLRQYPDVVENIAKVYIMGGNIGHGNHSSFTEYNIAGDPEAAQIVFHSGLSVHAAPLEIGDKAHSTQDQMDKIKECGEIGKILYLMLSHIHEPDGDLRIKIYDPTAVDIMLHPEFFILKPANVEIELAGRYTYGISVMDFLSKEHNAQIVTDVDIERFATWFVQSIRAANNGRR